MTDVGGAKCGSCGMPVETGPYCRHCVDEHGRLQAFEVRLARMSRWLRDRDPALSGAEAESRTLAHMAAMPAWRDHPELKRRLADAERG